MAGETCIVRKTPHILVNLSFLEIQDPIYLSIYLYVCVWCYMLKKIEQVGSIR